MSSRILRALLAALVLAAPAAAFQRETTDDDDCTEASGVNCAHHGTPLSWFQMPVEFFINPSGSGVGAGAAATAAERAFDTWERESLGGIVFSFGGSTSIGSDGSDGRNVISWQDLSSTSDTFAQSILTYDTGSGELLDTDIELNENFPWAVLPSGEDNPADPRVDVQSTLTHEAGHLLGLAHENRFGPSVVMFFSDTSGNTRHRTLAGDDRDGVREIYPDTGGGDGGGGGGGGGGCRVEQRGRSPEEMAAVGLAIAWLVLRRRRSKA